jgi:hypothetical protein
MFVDLNKQTIKLAKQVIKQAYFESKVCKHRYVKQDYYKAIANLARKSCVTAKNCKQTMQDLIIFIESRAGNNFLSYLENNQESVLIERILGH